jgi:hypothetical protein
VRTQNFDAEKKRQGELLQVEKDLFEKFGGPFKEKEKSQIHANRNFEKIEPQKPRHPDHGQKRPVEKDDGNLIPKMSEKFLNPAPPIMKQSQQIPPKVLDDTMPDCTLGQNPMGQVKNYFLVKF